jgi:hypothetical protein
MYESLRIGGQHGQPSGPHPAHLPCMVCRNSQRPFLLEVFSGLAAVVPQCRCLGRGGNWFLCDLRLSDVVCGIVLGRILPFLLEA